MLRSVHPSMAEYIEAKVRPITFMVPAALSLIFAILAGFLSVMHEVQASRELASSIGEHLISLIELQDGHEIQRLLRSLNQPNRRELSLIHNGTILASTGSADAIRRTEPEQQGLRLFSGIFFDDGQLVIRSPVRARYGTSSNSTLVASLNATPLFQTALWVGLAIFILGVFLSRFYVNLTKKRIQESIKPLEDLGSAIKKLAQDVMSVFDLPSSQVAELELIRQNILDTQEKLAVARELLADARAKELATDAYRRLIHDLHAPVACLSSIAKQAADSPEDDYIQSDAKQRIPRLAQQLLAQISSASKNLEFDEPQLEFLDLKQTVFDCVDQFSSLLDGKECKLSTQLPEHEVCVEHDRVLVTRSLLNLLKNSKEAGAKKIGVTLENGHGVKVIVSDNGPGLKAEQVTLFLKGRGRSSKRDRFAIGLSTVNHIIRNHGGRVIYKPTPGGGATFELQFAKMSERAKTEAVNGV